ncbi:phospholipase D-like domain-containing protein [Nostoc sp. TCL26-01]|uniref:phospholipase D-like domain-containing protein n=1 Tax=Nostoc sp. TCL26-01 TaxID=2576904 RepID=UPI0015BF2C53|nr:phospholipase D-like domain-containing protein [Nostoc sp. TCL26-01]QLE59798.1 hypothetical protein FD725_30650 [Nostoc sp. TCL26-01]
MAGSNNFGFDIQDLLNFPHALACCKKCLAISRAMKRNRQQHIHCPICRVQYIVHGNSEFEQFRAYFKNKGLYIQNHQIFEHCRQLAAIAHRINQYSPDYPPLAGLLQAFHLARQFVHFTTFGISKDFLLVLKFIAQHIQVRGIVALTPDQSWVLSELESSDLKTPNFCIKTICTSTNNWKKLPHQKLIVIDGLMAFKGSANLTTTAWRKAAHFYDVVEVVTQIDEVITHHNRYFSTVWANLSEHSDIITIGSDPFDDSVA